MATERPIYLDHGATTPVDADVLERMLPFFREQFGNAASKSHRFGWEAEEVVAAARQQVAALIGAQAKEVVFTSGATEANNLAVTGAARARKDEGRHVVVSAAEHKAVLDPAKALLREGFRVSIAPVDSEGICTAAAVQSVIEDDTILVSTMVANNEIGSLSPVAAIAEVAHAAGATFHVDAAQAAGKIELDVRALDVDLLSLSAHKMYGPKGIGALFVRRRPRTKVMPLAHGGGHERGLRSGTLDVPSIVGFGAAAEIAREKRAAFSMHLKALRDRLWAALSSIPAVQLHGPAPGSVDEGGNLRRLPDNLSVAFACVEAEVLLLKLAPTVALSSGSACTSAQLSPSHVLQAIGCGNDIAHSTLRFGVGRDNTAAEIDRVAAAVAEQVAALREQSAQWRARGGA